MDPKTFEELVNDPGLLNKDTLTELEQLVKEYPFCQSLHLLYTKNLKRQKHFRYHQQLKVAAAVVSDRSRLKHYIEDAGQPKAVEQEPSVTTPVEQESHEVVVVEAVLPHVEDAPQMAAEVEENEISNDLVFITAAEIANVTEALREIQSGTPTVDELADGDVKAVAGQSEELAESGQSGISVQDAGMSKAEKKRALIERINRKFAERELQREEEETPVVIPPVVPVETEPVGAGLPTEAIFDDPTSNPLEEELIEESITSNSEMNSTEADDHSEIAPDGESLSAVIPETNSDVEPGVRESEVTSQIPANELIDRFIRNSPSISRPSRSFYNPVNLAAQSLEEREEFYTETYASICLRQGNVEKALKIYEQLSLKFPEKSSYFAGLIEKVRKEQNI